MPEFITSNLMSYTVENPLYNVIVANPPVNEFLLTGTLPAGLKFSTINGEITGKITETTPGFADYVLSATNRYGTSNLLNFRITYTIALAPTIISPQDNLQITSGAYTSYTTESPLFEIEATQALGGTNNFDPGLDDTTRNNYTAVGIPPGFTLDVYTGKFYGTLASTEIPTDPAVISYTRTYTVQINATNPVGSAYTVIKLAFLKSLNPIVYGSIPANSTKTVLKETAYTTGAPFGTLLATNNPTTFTATNLPPGLTITSEGKIIGRVNTTLPAKAYNVQVTATNTFGESDPLSFTIKVPISILSPSSGSQFSAILNKSIDVFTVVTSGSDDPADPPVLTSSELPSGLVLADNKISGTPTKLGNSTISVLATTNNYQKASTKVVLKIIQQPTEYKISGYVFDDYEQPVSGVTVSSGPRTATTNNLGYYKLSGFSAGSYNVVPTAGTSTILPEYAAVDVLGADVSDINFILKYDEDYRIISGYVTDVDDAPITEATITTSYGACCTVDDVGYYEIMIPQNLEVSIFVSSYAYRFSIDSIIVSAGTDELSNQNFTGIFNEFALLSLESHDKQLYVNFSVSDALAANPDIEYFYSVDGGATYINSKNIIISKILSPLSGQIDLTTIITDSMAADPDIEYFYSVDGGTTYIPTQLL